jgi:5,10-methylene-tetrahydrofolate dehydrogenase/methenyl tetrahydrofolate cyclohydrolase
LKCTAVADYVSRIKISLSWKESYLHYTPNGYTSVYCHLQNLEEIDDYIKSHNIEIKILKLKCFLKLEICEKKAKLLDSGIQDHQKGSLAF